MTDKHALRMRNYLNTAVISGVKLLHLTTDELSGLLDELEAEEKLIAEQQRSLDHCEFLLLSADQVQREYAEALGCAGDNESILEAIDDMKKRIAELEAREVKIPYLPADCDRTEAHFKYQEAIRAAGIQVIEGEQKNG
ncbi:hypothetical protein ACSR9G_01945 [Citrobacter koseri]|uniref:hypothetical protein n=1 Tax=Citrobacter koseri TaxID=545 RepID=UPI00403A5F27